jgi:hypothetical protein
MCKDSQGFYSHTHEIDNQFHSKYWNLLDFFEGVALSRRLTTTSITHFIKIAMKLRIQFNDPCESVDRQIVCTVFGMVLLFWIITSFIVPFSLRINSYSKANLTDQKVSKKHKRCINCR